MTIIAKAFYFLQMISIIYGFNLRKMGLQNMITARAFITTLTEKINTEIISDSDIVNELTDIQYSHHIENMFYVAIYTSLLYGAIVYSTYYNHKPKIEKLKNIEMFSNTKKKMNLIIFTLIIFFTKNIENAT